MINVCFLVSVAVLAAVVRSRPTGTKKQADFSCMDARKAVY